MELSYPRMVVELNQLATASGPRYVKGSVSVSQALLPISVVVDVDHTT